MPRTARPPWQETATIFLRLLKLLNKTLPEIEEVKTFTDAADIAAWAEEAVETMQTAGVLTGYPGRQLPAAEPSDPR